MMLDYGHSDPMDPDLLSADGGDLRLTQLHLFLHPGFGNVRDITDVCAERVVLIFFDHCGP